MNITRLIAIAIIPVAFFSLSRPAPAHAFSPEDVTAQVATFIGNDLLTSVVALTDTLNWTTKSVFKKKVEFKKKIEVDGEATFHDKAFLDKLGKVKTLKVTGDSTIGNSTDDLIIIEGKIKRTLGKVYIKDGLRVNGDFVLDTATVDTDEIKNETLLSKDIADGKIQGKDIKDGTLTASKFASTYAEDSAQVVVVGPGASAVASGTALKAAVEGISDASAAKPYVVQIEPGVYDLASTTITIPSYVSLEGSGETVTIIDSDLDSGVSAPIIPSSNVNIRHLTIQNISGTATAMRGIYIGAGITDVYIEYVTVTLDGYSSTLTEYGVYVETTGSAVLNHVTINILDRPIHLRGIMNIGTITCYACDVSIYGDGVMRAIYNQGTLTLYDSRVSVRDSGVASPSIGSGIYIDNGTASIFNSVVSSIGADSTDYGIRNESQVARIVVERSTIIGDTDAVKFGAASTFDGGASQLDGGIDNSGAGTFTCASAYDGSFAAINASCL